MNKQFVILLITVFITISLFTGCADNDAINPKQATTITVAATIFPLADLAQVVGGDLVDVVTLLPPGSSPHTFEPTPEQMKQLSNAEVFIQVGAGLDSFADKLARAANPDLQIVTITHGLPLSPSFPHETEPEHQLKGDPHIWLDPVLVREHVLPQITAALTAANADGADYFNSNEKMYGEALELLHQDLQQTISSFQHHTFITFHSVWHYFGQRYGLDDVSIEDFPSKEPSAQWLADIVEKSKTNQAQCVFVEPQISAKAAQIIADEIGIPVYTLDPLGAANKPGYDSYLKMMRSNLTILEQALR